ncbi:MAG: nucleotidyltransferase [Candidatus Omnitrophica bacterium]|nr:nucleotidyltransferase [Candidatus Omnitrophota bacterium]
MERTVIKNLPEEFNVLKKIENPFKKRLYFVGILTKYLSYKNIKPVIVGGHAVEFYTLGSYTTGDIDLICEGYDFIKELLKEWKFKKQGRLWILPEEDIEIDIVSSYLKDDDPSKISEVTVENLKVYIIGIEDLIVDRLNAFVWWKSEEDKKWIRMIVKLHFKEIDKDYMEKRTKQEKTFGAWEKIKNEKI